MILLHWSISKNWNWNSIKSEWWWRCFCWTNFHNFIENRPRTEFKFRIQIFSMVEIYNIVWQQSYHSFFWSFDIEENGNSRSNEWLIFNHKLHKRTWNSSDLTRKNIFKNKIFFLFIFSRFYIQSTLSERNIWMICWACAFSVHIKMVLKIAFLHSLRTYINTNGSMKKKLICKIKMPQHILIASIHFAMSLVHSGTFANI